jgi:phosphoribosylformylglycinamidine (FGAM) synthase-like enzyme
MATTKERMLITLTPRVAREVRAIARREQMPRATVAARMLSTFVDDIDDTDLTETEERTLARIVRERDTPGTRWLTEKQADALFEKLHKS